MANKKARVEAPDEVVQDAYLDWLLEIVNPGRLEGSADLLATHLHLIEWYAIWPRDVSRENDGKNLRERFKKDSSFSDYTSIEGPCTFLECAIGIAEHMDFFCTPPELQPATYLYFWKLLQNAKILGHGIDIRAIDTSVDRVLTRSYTTKGTGGFFPLQHPETNQKGVEIWYQMAAYLGENPRLYRDLATCFECNRDEKDPFKILS